MRDHNRSAVLRSLFQCNLDNALTDYVERACRLVEYQNFRFSDDGPGDADPLALATAELYAYVADRRVISLSAG